MGTQVNRGILPYRRCVQITPGTPVAPGHGVHINCTSAGTINLKFEDGTILPAICAAGSNMVDDMAIVDSPAGGTGTATVFVLYC